MEYMRKRRKIGFNIPNMGVVFILMFVLLVFLSIFCLIRPIFICEEQVEIGLNEQFNPKQGVKLLLFGDKDDVTYKGEINNEKYGTYPIVYTYRGRKLNGNVVVKNKIPPTLEVKAYTTDTKESVKASSFVKKCKGKSKVSFHFEKEPSHDKGEQTVTIIARDQEGNETTKRTKLIRKEDKKKPTVHIRGNINFYVGDRFDYDKFIAYSDNLDKNVKLKVDLSKVNKKQPGTYPIQICVSDRSGNSVKIKDELTLYPEEEKNKKIVYLTFDDGPSDNTAKILEILKRYDAKATFFVTGRNPKCNKNITKADKEGHTIALHTYTHDYADVYSSIDAYFNDLNKLSDMVEELTNKKPYLIRFPGGSSNTISANYTPGIMSKLTKMLHEMGYEYFDWNCDSTDASGNNVPVSQLVANATNCNMQYVNILMHDTDAKDTTVAALPQIIENYRKRGYVFRGLNIDSFAPHHPVNN